MEISLNFCLTDPRCLPLYHITTLLYRYNIKGENHILIASWKNNYAVENPRPSYHVTKLEDYVTEGYQNLLFVFAN